MLLDIDLWVFEWVNQGWSSAILDAILIPIRDKYIWLPVYVFIVSFAIINKGKAGYMMVLALMITVGTADLVSNKMVKHNVERLRPCKALDTDSVTVRVRCGSGYSFTSNHAANHFALSTFLWLLIGSGRWRWGLFVWAAAISVAQVYVGVHYPTDIFGGAMLGYIIARVGYLLYRRYLMPIFTIPSVE